MQTTSVFCLENPMNSKKRQKDRTVKDELPRSGGAQNAPGDQWRNNSRKNEETETKLESRLVGEISITSDMQMTPPYDRK